MAGEYITAKTIKEYWKKLKAYHQTQSPEFYEINQEEYDSFSRSEREDSDNHLNQKRLGSETQVSEATFYKYLPHQKIAYRSHIVDADGNREDHYFIVKTSNSDLITQD